MHWIEHQLSKHASSTADCEGGREFNLGKYIPLACLPNDQPVTVTYRENVRNVDKQKEYTRIDLEYETIRQEDGTKIHHELTLRLHKAKIVVSNNRRWKKCLKLTKRPIVLD